jgi:hypothetical protein
MSEKFTGNSSNKTLSGSSSDWSNDPSQGKGQILTEEQQQDFNTYGRERSAAERFDDFVNRNPRINLVMNGRELGDLLDREDELGELYREVGESDEFQKASVDARLSNPKIQEKNKNGEPLSDIENIEALAHSVNLGISIERKLQGRFTGSIEDGTAARVVSEREKYLTDVYNAFFNLNGPDSVKSIDLILSYVDEKINDDFDTFGDDPAYQKSAIKNDYATKEMFLNLKREAEQAKTTARPEQREAGSHSESFKHALEYVAQVEETTPDPAKVDDILVSNAESHPDDLDANRAAIVESALETTFGVNMPQGTPVERIINDTGTTRGVEAANNTFSDIDRIDGSPKGVRQVVDDIIGGAKPENQGENSQSKEQATKDAEKQAEQERQRQQAELFDKLYDQIAKTDISDVNSILQQIAVAKGFSPIQANKMQSDFFVSGVIQLDSAQIQRVNAEIMQMASLAQAAEELADDGDAVKSANDARRSSMQRALLDILARYRP